MREIKFRAWHKGAKVMAEMPQEYEDFVFHEDCERVASDCSIGHAIFDRAVELMQYTGLKDCSGVEIYEGDILKVTSEVGNETLVVGYFMGNACFMFPGHETGTPIYPALINMTKEVIGNIHQNPELLEAEQC